MALISETAYAPRAMLVLALVPALGIILGGFNSMFGNGVVALAYGVMLAGFAISMPPDMRFWRRAAPALALAGAAFIWAVLSWVLGTPVAPDVIPSALIGYAGMVAALLCGAMLGFSRAQMAPFLDGLLAFGCVGLALGLVLLRGDTAPMPFWRGEFEGRFLGTLANANATGATYGSLAALAFARALSAIAERSGHARQWRAGLFGLVAVAFVAGLVLTASRSGVVLTIMAFGLVAARALRRSTALTALVLVGSALVLVLVEGYADTLFARFARLPGEVVVRQILWTHNWAVARQAPLFGYGLGSFPEVNTHSLSGIRETQAIWMTNSPHDILLRLMIDAGAPYLLLILACGAVIAAQIMRAVGKRQMSFEETALVAGVLLVLGSATVDIALEVPAVTALTLTWTGLIWGRAIARLTSARSQGSVRQIPG